MTGYLEGKVAIVTGAGRGIGRAIAERLARDGAAVVAADRDEDTAQGTARALASAGRRSLAVTADVGTTEGRRRLIEAAVETFHRLDILINNAGIVHAHRPEAVTEAEWDAIMNVNCKAVFFACVAARPHLARAGGGRIVNLASIAGKIATPWWAPYGVADSRQLRLPRADRHPDVAPGRLRGGSAGDRLRPGSVHEKTAREHPARPARAAGRCGGRRGVPLLPRFRVHDRSGDQRHRRDGHPLTRPGRGVGVPT
ncbi:MAG: SDR family oxidoreductase [Bacillati bacterium ANGP1]|uniref:SDR family oxidoreductase n=1 Tax=Candidatus Segetimicrobium genomatis TaxID=2569760 RepID=A0A537JFI2_9BACT|nr:MAG: SDR family oxidoreductase [Terrabacteria group bacterium ANGP1]